MKRDFLKDLGLDEETINKIMAENGRDVEKAKADSEKTAAKLEQTENELQKANETLDKMKDYDQAKADVEKYKAEAAASKSEYEKRLADIELDGKVKDFTGQKKFVNDFTRESINAELKKALGDKANAGKSMDELLKALTDGKENIFVDDKKPEPPKAPNFQDKQPGTDGVLAAFQRMNPGIKL